MAINIITVRQMLREMETGAPFRIAGVTYDAKRRTGGRIYDYQAILLRGDNNPHDPQSSDTLPDPQRPLTDAELGLPSSNPGTPNRRNPNHKAWFTRNVAVCQNGQRTAMILKIHIPLIVYFNGKIVVP